ncbi:hypothetical protein PPERSA_04450 [Pseudocohnilembus persalinus]|uniref:USP domain-containing protein n=1 Tax=Pseudocohnilembus persalinus TaxID=266149 RepID=A0A0V0QQU1_PSEPJ|nr:hypothetical protein PPERSA_04450 [Pseudocohnilembus persalinus]|eukprot:KRX04635.1 hypothetical protein PPERSA_04450 [Pseudocohnilembus persalinus]
MEIIGNKIAQIIEQNIIDKALDQQLFTDPYNYAIKEIFKKKLVKLKSEENGEKHQNGNIQLFNDKIDFTKHISLIVQNVIYPFKNYIQNLDKLMLIFVKWLCILDFTVFKKDEQYNRNFLIKSCKDIVEMIYMICFDEQNITKYRIQENAVELFQLIIRISKLKNLQGFKLTQNFFMIFESLTERQIQNLVQNNWQNFLFDLACQKQNNEENKEDQEKILTMFTSLTYYTMTNKVLFFLMQLCKIFEQNNEKELLIMIYANFVKERLLPNLKAYHCFEMEVDKRLLFTKSDLQTFKVQLEQIQKIDQSFFPNFFMILTFINKIIYDFKNDFEKRQLIQELKENYQKQIDDFNPDIWHFKTFKFNNKYRYNQQTGRENKLTNSIMQSGLVQDGIENIGFTCYLNSTLQCLYRTEKFKNYILSEDNKELSLIDSIYDKNNYQSNFDLNVEVYNLFEFLSSDYVKKFPYQPQCLKMSMPEPFRSVTQQQDVQEYIAQLLDAFIEADKRKFGLYTKQYDLLKMIKQNFIEELLDKQNQYQCDKCNKKTDAKKQLDLEELPPYLIIGLNRSIYDQKNQLFIKNLSSVSIPFEFKANKIYENFEQFNNENEYELYAIIIHIGQNIFSGHYIAYHKIDEFNWKVSDDSQSFVVKGYDYQSLSRQWQDQETPYVLFYRNKRQKRIKPQSLNNKYVNQSKETYNLQFSNRQENGYSHKDYTNSLNFDNYKISNRYGPQYGFSNNRQSDSQFKFSQSQYQKKY